MMQHKGAQNGKGNLGGPKAFVSVLSVDSKARPSFSYLGLEWTGMALNENEPRQGPKLAQI